MTEPLRKVCELCEGRRRCWKPNIGNFVPCPWCANPNDPIPKPEPVREAA